MEDLGKIVELGFDATLLFIMMKLWQSHQKLQEFFQVLLTDALDRNERDWQAARERRKLGDAVGANFDDTEGKRPPGMEERIKTLR